MNSRCEFPAPCSHLCAPADRGSRQLVNGVICGVGAVGIWAGWLVMMRVGVTSHLAAPDLAALRFSVGGLVLLPVLLRRGFAIDRLGYPGFVALALGGGAPYVLVVGTGLAFAPVAHAGALSQGLVPLVVSLLAATILGERLRRIQMVGLAVVLCGAFAVGRGGVSGVGDAQSVGHLCFIIAACLWAGYTIATRRARLSGMHAAAIAAVVSMLAYLPVYLVCFEHQLADAPFADIAWQAFYQGVLVAAVSLSLYGRAVSSLGASRAGSLVALAPVLAALMAMPALGEWPTSVDWLAITAITVGVYLAGGGPLRTWSAKLVISSTA